MLLKDYNNNKDLLWLLSHTYIFHKLSVSKHNEIIEGIVDTDISKLEKRERQFAYKNGSFSMINRLFHETLGTWLHGRLLSLSNQIL